MARKTSVLGFSVSPALAKEYERLAEREEVEFVALQRKMPPCSQNGCIH